MKKCSLRKNIRKLSLFLAAVLLAGASKPADVQAEESKTVKIGWYQSAQFQEGDSDDEPKSGYSYSYIQRVSDYSGWNYEYVYGDWADLYDKLISGEIDVLAGVSKTPERMEQLLFPDEYMGKEHYVLYQNGDTGDMVSSDIDSFEDKKIGAINNNLMTVYLEQWLSEHNAKAEIVYYDGFEDRDKDFEDGKIDAIVATDNSIMLESGCEGVTEVGAEDYYLAVAGDREDLLEDLNLALRNIQDIEPYFLNNLQYEYYGTTMADGTLTTTEKEWLAAHDSITVGYLDNYMPYCDTDDSGNATGLFTDVINESMNMLGISESMSISYKAYADDNELVEALKSGTVDIAFPIGGTTWQLENMGIEATEDVVTSSMYLVYNGAYSDDTLSSIAVYKGNLMTINYIKANYPQAKICEMDSIDDCLQSVLLGGVNSTIVNGLRLDIVTNNRKLSELSLLRLNESSGRCFGIEKGNTALLMLLNRGLKLVGQGYALNASYRYMSDLYTVTFADFMEKYIWMFASIAVCILIFVGYIMINAARREKAANQAKTTFLFNMSHDIRTPMNAILGYTDLLEKHSGDPDKCSEYIEKIRSSSNILLSLINNVLEMARIESGKTELNETVVDAKNLFREVSAVYAELMAEKNIKFEEDIRSSVSYFYGDEVKLREIFLNILSNAYKYTPAGGSIKVSISEMPSLKHGTVTTKTVISDTGIGMSKEFLPKIFEEFSREKTSTEDKIQGTGLGMPIVKRYVDLMGGKITVESELGKGSSFTIILTHRIADGPKIVITEDMHENGALFNGKRILLAEDNDFNAEIAMEKLEDYGFYAERAADGAICVDMLSKAPNGYYDLILMDVQMPNMDGYEATRAIRAMKDKAKSEIPIIAMTANAFESDKKDAIEAGMNDHLAKPIEKDKFAAVLKRVLNE